MATLNYDDTVELFSNLKKSIDTFRSKNYHLEVSGVFNMVEILQTCSKMEIFLSGDFEQLWRIEHEYTKELRKKLELIPIGINKNKGTSTEDSFDDLPELIPLYCDDMPPLIPLSDDEDDMPGLIPLYCDDMPPLSKISHEDMPSLFPNTLYNEYSTIDHDVNEKFCHLDGINSEPYTSPIVSKSNLWNWPTYNPVSALMFNQQVRDL